MNRQFFIVITVVVLALVGVFALNSKKDGGNDGKVTDAQPSSHITGAKESKVTLIEYGDFSALPVKLPSLALAAQGRLWRQSSFPIPPFPFGTDSPECFYWQPGG